MPVLRNLLGDAGTDLALEAMPGKDVFRVAVSQVAGTSELSESTLLLLKSAELIWPQLESGVHVQSSMELAHLRFALCVHMKKKFFMRD